MITYTRNELQTAVRICNPAIQYTTAHTYDTCTSTMCILLIMYIIILSLLNTMSNFILLSVLLEHQQIQIDISRPLYKNAYVFIVKMCYELLHYSYHLHLHFTV